MDIVIKAMRHLSMKTLSVLLFHKVPVIEDTYSSPGPCLYEFEKTLDFVSENYKVISLSEAVIHLENNSLPKNAACLTFDDGYPDWISGVLPVLLARNMHATFFITSQQLNGEAMWHERINYVLKKNRGKPLIFPLELISNNESFMGNPALLAGKLEDFLKYRSVSSRDAFLRELETLNGASSDEVPRMNIEQLREIHSKGFEVGAHTISHPILSLCSKESAWNEISGTREILSELIKGDVSIFAYPNGNPCKDFRAEHIQMVKKAGYRAAVSTHRGVARSGDSIFQIPRFTPWGPNTFKYAWQMIRNNLSSVKFLEER